MQMPNMPAPPKAFGKGSGSYYTKTIDEALWPGAERMGWKRHRSKPGAWTAPNGEVERCVCVCVTGLFTVTSKPSHHHHHTLTLTT